MSPARVHNFLFVLILLRVRILRWYVEVLNVITVLNVIFNGPIVPAQVANQNTGFTSSCPCDSTHDGQLTV